MIKETLAGDNNRGDFMTKMDIIKPVAAAPLTYQKMAVFGNKPRLPDDPNQIKYTTSLAGAWGNNTLGGDLTLNTDGTGKYVYFLMAGEFGGLHLNPVNINDMEGDGSLDMGTGSTASFHYVINADRTQMTITNSSDTTVIDNTTYDIVVRLILADTGPEPVSYDRVGITITQFASEFTRAVADTDTTTFDWTANPNPIVIKSIGGVQTGGDFSLTTSNSTNTEQAPNVTRYGTLSIIPAGTMAAAVKAKSKKEAIAPAAAGDTVKITFTGGVSPFSSTRPWTAATDSQEPIPQYPPAIMGDYLKSDDDAIADLQQAGEVAGMVGSAYFYTITDADELTAALKDALKKAKTMCFLSGLPSTIAYEFDWTKLEIIRPSDPYCRRKITITDPNADSDQALIKWLLSADNGGVIDIELAGKLLWTQSRILQDFPIIYDQTHYSNPSFMGQDDPDTTDELIANGFSFFVSSAQDNWAESWRSGGDPDQASLIDYKVRYEYKEAFANARAALRNDTSNINTGIIYDLTAPNSIIAIINSVLQANIRTGLVTAVVAINVMPYDSQQANDKKVQAWRGISFSFTALRLLRKGFVTIQEVQI